MELQRLDISYHLEQLKINYTKEHKYIFKTVVKKLNIRQQRKKILERQEAN